MAIALLVNGTLTGLAADTKPTTYPAGTTFFETDTGSEFYYNGSTWAAMAGGSGGGAGGAVTSVSKTTSDSPYTIVTGDSTIRADASSGALVLTLPTAVGVTGKSYTIRRTDILASTNLVTIATTSSQTIDSAPNHYLWPAEFVEVQSDGANWFVTNRTSISHMGYMLKGATAARKYAAGNQALFGQLITSTTSPQINQLWAIGFIVQKTTKFDTISFNITTGAASSNARAGIYRDNGNMYPGALIFDTGAIVTTGTGEKATTITSGLQTFPAGMYWLAWECDTTGLQILSIGSTGLQFAFLGFTATATTPSYGYSVAHTFGALPDPYTAGAGILTTAPAVGNPVPAIYLRAI